MEKSVPAIGFAILSIIALVIFGGAVYQAWLMAPLVGIVLTVALIGLLYTLSNEAKSVKDAKSGPLFNQKNLVNILAVMAGALVSYVINVNLAQGAVIGAAVVGVLAGFLLKDYAVPIYTGALVGMASSKLFASPLVILLPALIAGVVYVLALTAFGGFGGKLGTIAVTGCITCAIALGNPFVAGKVPSWTLGWMLVVTAVVAGVAAYYINNNMKQGPVIGSAAVGLVAGILLPLLFGANGKTMATVAILASFGGMSTAKRIPSLLWMGVAAAIAGVVFIYNAPLVGGAGGRLGAMAFGSGMATRGLLDLIAKYMGGKK
jgi:hypothetical protein